MYYKVARLPIGYAPPPERDNVVTVPPLVFPSRPIKLPHSGGGEEKIAISPLGGWSQSGGEMRRCVLCGRWARLAFPRAREKKSSSSHIGKIDEACQSNSCLPAPDRRLVGARNGDHAGQAW